MRSAMFFLVLLAASAVHAQDFRIGTTRKAVLDTLRFHPELNAAGSENADTVAIEGVLLAGHRGWSIIDFDSSGLIENTFWLSSDRFKRKEFDFWVRAVSSYLGKPQRILKLPNGRPFSWLWVEPGGTVLEALYQTYTAHVTISRRPELTSDLTQ